MAEDNRALARGEMAVLALLAERPAHGWAVSREVAPGAEIGEIWSGDRQRVYRALRKLNDEGLIEASLTEPGEGAYRTVFRPTRSGRALLKAWLQQPVEHMRDAHSTFVLKLVFLQRAGLDPTALLAAQRATVVAAVESLAAKVRATDPEHAVHLRLRLETTRGLLNFIDDLMNASAARSQTVQAPRRSSGSAPLLGAVDDIGRGSGAGDGSGGGRRGRNNSVRVSDFSGRELGDEADSATIILRYGDPGGGIVVASAHVEDPVVGEIAGVAQSASPRRASG